jgi:hypothetical protein
MRAFDALDTPKSKVIAVVEATAIFALFVESMSDPVSLSSEPKSLRDLTMTLHPRNLASMTKEPPSTPEMLRL